MNPEENGLPLEEERLVQEPNDNDIFAHMNNREVEELSSIQPSGITRNNPWNIPEFHELNDIIFSNPEIKNQVAGAIHSFVGGSSSDKKNIQKQSSEVKSKFLPPEQEIDIPEAVEAPEAAALAEMGEGSDDQIVLMPKTLFEFFWDNVPEEYHDVNKETGFPQFAFWGPLIGGIVGSFIPVVGTSLGAALGGGAEAIGSSMFGGSSEPAQAKSYSDGYDYDEDDYGDEYGDDETDYSRSLMEALGMGINKAHDHFIKKPQEASKKQEPGQEKTKSVQDLVGDIITGGLEIFGLGGGSNPQEDAIREMKGERKNLRKYRQKVRKDALENRLYNKTLYDNFMKRFHPSSGYNPAKPEMEQSENAKKIDFARPLNSYKDGGAVRTLAPLKKSQYIEGDEGGQEDNIYVDVPHGSYILDASTVSQIGDGCSDNGAKRLTEFFEKLPTKNLNKDKKPMVACALSAGEFKISPEHVLILGNGKLEKGTKILDDFVKKIRKYKDMNTNKIPKPTKDLTHYIKVNLKAVGV